MDILGQSSLILAVASFALAVTALARNLRNKLVMTYALLCGVMSAWAFCFFLEKVFGTGTFYRAHLVFNLLLAPTGLFFVRVLTRVENSFTRWLYVASLVYSVTVIGLELSSLSSGNVVRNLAFFGPSFLVIICFYLMSIDWRLKRVATKRSGRTKPSTVGLTRRSWIYSGALVLLATAAMDHVPAMGDIVPSAANVLLCLYMFMISEAIIHQRLLNVSALLNRIALVVVVATVFSVIYMILVAWIDSSPALFALNTFLASFIITLLVDPMKKLTGMAIGRLLSRKFVRFEAQAEDAQQQLTGILDTVGLAQLSLAFLEKALACDSATIFVLRSDGTKYRRIRGLRDEALANREILATHPIIEFFNRMRRRGEAPVVLDQYLENEIDRTTSDAQRQAYDIILKGLQGLNANILIPYMDGAETLGFAAIRSLSPPEPWGNNWGVLSVIYPFFLQAARTLKNMDVYVRLREKDRLAALGEMAAGLAHEIRNPLGAIKGAAQYLQPQSEGPQAAFLSVIVEEVNRLNKVVTQFLDYSRPLTSELVDSDIGTIIEKTHALFIGAGMSSPEDAATRLELVTPPGGFRALPHAACSPEQVKQVLVNLVQNSLQSLRSAPPVGGGVVRIGAAAEKRRRDGASELVIFVEDNGKGIPRENLEKIFIPFFTTNPTGTGLGLPICSRIVEAHGGVIDVVSEEGKMTRFSIHLPVSVKL